MWVTGCDSVNFFTQSKCRACNALCPLFMAQPDPRYWAVSDVLAIHGAMPAHPFYRVQQLEGVRPGLLLRVEYDGKASNCIGREYGLLDELVYSEQLDPGQSHLLILARTYFQDFVWSGRKETQPGRGRCREQVEKEVECKSKEASVKQGRKKHSYAIVQVSDNSGEKETEAGNAQSAMAKAKRSRQPSKKVLVNAEQ
eukprot:g50760.t1